MKEISAWAVPVVVAFILIYGLIRRVPVFSEFVAGAGEGAKNSIEILPSLIGLIAGKPVENLRPRQFARKNSICYGGIDRNNILYHCRLLWSGAR